MKKIFKKVKFRYIVMFSFIIYLSVNLIANQFNVMQRKQEYEELLETQAQLEMEVDEQERILQEEDITVYLERMARELLGYADAQERVFIDIQTEK